VFLVSASDVQLRFHTLNIISTASNETLLSLLTALVVGEMAILAETPPLEAAVVLMVGAVQMPTIVVLAAKANMATVQTPPPTPAQV